MGRYTDENNIRFTNGTAKTLVVPEGKKDKLWFDTEVRGFFIRKFKSGKAVYGVKYTCKGQQRRVTLGPVLPGNLEKMRALASDAIAKARLGDDVVAQARAAREAAKAKKLGELLPVYLTIREHGSPDKKWMKLKPNTLAQATRYLKRAWEPFHKLAPDDVTRDKVKERLDELTATSGPIAANRAHAYLSTFFAWLIHNNHCKGVNPTMGLKLGQEEPRSRKLSEPELVDVYLAAGNDDFGMIVKLLILTAQRLREIGDLEWSEIGWEERLIELPATRTKNGHEHSVPLSAPVLALLRAIPRHERRLVFSGPRSTRMTNYSSGKAQLDKRITACRGGEPLPHWTLHDLRRSVATRLAQSRERRRKMGHLEEIETYSFAKPHIVESILNHLLGSRVARTYNLANYLPEMRQALEQWGAHFMDLIETRVRAHHSDIREYSGDSGGKLVSGT